MPDAVIPKRVLIAEDEKAYSRALALKLSRLGFEVETAADGDEAVSALHQSHFDALLLDLVMPKRNGFSVLEEMRERGLTMPVVVLTNLTQQEDRRRAIDLGARAFIEKSNASVVDVVAQVRQLVSA